MAWRSDMASDDEPMRVSAQSRRGERAMWSAMAEKRTTPGSWPPSHR